MNGVRNLKFVDGRSELVATYYGRYCRLMDGLIGMAGSSHDKLAILLVDFSGGP